MKPVRIFPGLLTGQNPTSGSHQEVFQILVIPVGSGQEVIEMSRVGSRGFLAIMCRVGSRGPDSIREKWLDT